MGFLELKLDNNKLVTSGDDHPDIFAVAGLKGLPKSIFDQTYFCQFLYNIRLDILLTID